MNSEAIEAAVHQVVAVGQTSLASNPNQVLEVLERQARQLLHQQNEILAYRHQLAQLQEEIEALKQSPRSVAPFRIDDDKRQQNCKRPGRKLGHPGVYRTSPAVSANDEQIEVRLEVCPHCGAPLDVSTQRAVEQTLIEVPQVQPRVIRLRTYRNQCEECQCSISSHHPLQVTTATGAAGTHLGPRALGFAAALNKDLGLTMRKTCRVLQECFGIMLSPGGLSQALKRIASRLQPTYDQELDSLRQSEVIYTDETGWWVGGPGYSLWVATNPQTTIYRVVPRRDRATARVINTRGIN